MNDCSIKSWLGPRPVTPTEPTSLQTAIELACEAQNNLSASLLHKKRLSTDGTHTKRIGEK